MYSVQYMLSGVLLVGVCRTAVIRKQAVEHKFKLVCGAGAELRLPEGTESHTGLPALHGTQQKWANLSLYQTRAPEHRLVVFGVLPSLPPDNYALLVYKGSTESCLKKDLLKSSIYTWGEEEEYPDFFDGALGQIRVEEIGRRPVAVYLNQARVPLLQVQGLHLLLLGQETGWRACGIIQENPQLPCT